MKIAKLSVKEIINEFEETVETTKDITYVAAYINTEKVNDKPKSCMSKRMHKQPSWKTKIEQEINTIRREVFIIKVILRGVKIKPRKLNKMNKNYLMKKTDDQAPLKKALKQKIQPKVQRIRRYKKRTKFYRENKIFENRPKEVLQ